MIYLDHAATSWPKPPPVLQAMNDFLEHAGANPGRSGHRMSVEAGRVVYETRELIARFFNAPDPLRVVFTSNATHAINIALFGVLKPGDTVATTSMEHNAVMRPLRALEKKGVAVRVVPCDRTGLIDLETYKATVAQGVRLAVVSHASNVTGTIQPLEDLCRISHHYGTVVLVDAAQTAGFLPIDMQSMGIDILAFTGHKALQGPPGIGGLVLGEQFMEGEMSPLIYGGTGSNSDSETQPSHLPDKFEGGTLNSVGIAGLRAGIEWVLETGLAKIRAHHSHLTRALLEGLKQVPGVSVYGSPSEFERAPVVSFRLEGQAVSHVGLRLDLDYSIMCRVGLHCAPAAHRTIGTFPEGTIRFSIGPMTTEEEIEQAISAVWEIGR